MPLQQTNQSKIDEGIFVYGNHRIVVAEHMPPHGEKLEELLINTLIREAQKQVSKDGFDFLRN